MKTILLPTDFSSNSVNAIHYAVNLYKNEPCQFHLLNIQKASSFLSDNLMTMQSSTTIYKTLVDVSKKSLKNIINAIITKYDNNLHEFKDVVDYDNFVDAVNQMVEKEKIDIIIMGTKGATNAEKVIFGSNTVRIMQRCSVPVLAIPKGCKYKEIDKIAFTSNYLTHYKKSELFALIDIAKKYNSKIDVLHLETEEFLSREQVNNRAFLDTCFSQVSHEFIDLENADIFDTVKHYISQNDIKLLAMMSRKHSFLERLFTRHNVETFAFKINIPFLVMENTGKQLKN